MSTLPTLRTDRGHPCLYFSREDVPSILARAQDHPAFASVYDAAMAEARALLDTPVEPTPPPRTREARYHGSCPYDDYLQRNTKAAFTLAFAFQMTGREEHALKSYEFAAAVCDVPTWVPTVHEFPAIYDRVHPWGARDDQVVFSYGQMCDYVVFQLAAVYDWLHPALVRRQRDRIRGALLEKAITRVRGNYEYHWWAAAYRCNWCVVCNASLGVAALSLLGEDPDLVDVVAESYERIGKTFDEIGDGGWKEGMAYLTYALDAADLFARALDRATGGFGSLYRHPRIEDAVRTFLFSQVPPDRSLRFSDSDGGKPGSYRIFNRIAAETGNPASAWLRRALWRDRPVEPYDLLEPVACVEPALPLETSVHFRTAGWVVMRSDFTDPEKVVVAAKACANDDPHHGHLDAGHVSVYWRGTEFLSDQECPGYDRAYFDEARWTYPLASSAGHNVVLVDGEGQRPGKRKNRPLDPSIGGTIVETRFANDRCYALLDASAAYPGTHLTEWHRHIVLDKPDLTLIVDEVRCAEGAEVECRFHSEATIEILERHVRLAGSRGAMVLVPVAGGDFRLRPGSHTVLLAQRNARLKLVPYVGIVTRAEEGSVVLAAFIVPLNEGEDGTRAHDAVRMDVDGTGGLAFALDWNGRTRRYRFVRGEHGLALEQRKEQSG